MKSDQSGFTMLEVLITIIVVAIGLLGLAGLQTRILGAEVEGYQRSAAMMFVQDMVNVIRSNEDAALDGAFDDSGEIDCEADENDQFCQWVKKMYPEEAGGTPILINPIGCVEAVPGDPKTIRVSVAWQGMTPTVSPPDGLDCGRDRYGQETMRRIISAEVVVVDLTAE